MSQGCTWLFGRGASIANGLPWSVPRDWTADLLASRVTREAHIGMITQALRQEMTGVPEHITSYRRLLDIMANSTFDHGHCRAW